MSILIKNVFAVDPQSELERLVDIGIDGGIITALDDPGSISDKDAE